MFIKTFGMILCCVMLIINLNAQFYDNFSDGNFDSYPEWTGCVKNFIVNENNMLQTNPSSDVNEVWLFTPNEIMRNTVWNFRLMMNFSPSDNNCVIIWLCCDNSEPRNIKNGCFLKIGEQENNDAFEIYSLVNGNKSLILRGNNGNVSSSFVKDIRIKHTSDSDWILFSKNIDNEIFTKECEVNFTADMMSSFFGIVCKYTPSNAENFYFDNFDVHSISEIIDLPKVTSVLMRDKNILTVTFSEPIVNIDDKYNYMIDNSLIYPDYVIKANSSSTWANLVFSKDFIDDEIFNLQIKNIKGLDDNIMIDTVCNVHIYYIDYQDIIVDEVMYDVNPAPNALSPYDYIELYNRTNANIDISGWTITVSNKLFVFPPISVRPKSFLIVSSPGFILNDTCNIVSFSGFSVSNNDEILFWNNRMDLISHVVVSSLWYRNSDKSNGGWALEMINPEYPCLQSENWCESTELSGGTPCKINSVNNNKIQDINSAKIIRADVLDSITVILTFSETIDTVNVLTKTNYMIEPTLNIESLKFIGHIYDKIEIKFSNVINKDKLYYLMFLNLVFDCAGNSDVLGIEFGIGYVPDNKNIVINEILFDASHETKDYLELINCSDKLLDLSKLYVMYSSDTDAHTKMKFCSIYYNHRRLLKPNEIIVLTSDVSGLMEHYPKCDSESFQVIEDFPELNGNEGYIGLITDENNIIDSIEYNSSMHLKYLSDVKGVSLERISPYRLSYDVNNWHSAAQTCNYGSPGVQNSQYNVADIEDSDKMSLKIYPRIFTPNNDGQDDIVDICYSFQSTGGVSSCYIYDRDGIIVRHLLDNVLLETHGCVTWDGIDDRGRVVNRGTYIIVLESVSERKIIGKRREIVTIVGE